MNADLLRHWPLNPDVTFLNHGSFGSCPLSVLGVQDEWRARLERDPVKFMDGELEGHLDHARARLAELLGADPDDLTFVPNATTGVNTVLRSLAFEPGDEILTDDHEYNACLNAIRFVAQRAGPRAVIAPVPFPLASPDTVVDAILERVTPRTRLAVISHVTSPTGIVFPVERIVAELAARGIDTLVDGAHVPGMLELDIDSLGAAYYTGNAHKWLCTPKGSAFLHIRRDRQDRIRPLAISHGANSPRRDRSRYRLEADWGGTADPTPYLTIPAGIDFLAGLLPGGWSELRAHNRKLVLAGRDLLLRALGGDPPPVPDAMIGSLAAVSLPSQMPPLPDEPPEDAEPDETYPPDPLHAALSAEHRIEVPVFPWPHCPSDGPAPRQRLLRISAQAYNSIGDYEQLAAALSERLSSAGHAS